MNSRWTRTTIGGVTAALLLLGACSSDSGSETSSTAPTPDDTSAAAEPVDYSARGPYPVGTLTLTLDDRDAVVFYPTTDEAAAAVEPVTSYSSGEAFDETLRATVAELVPEFVQDIPLDAYDSPLIADDGPFPVILHSHGAGGSLFFAQQHYEHLASWGYVVAAPDHKSRNLAAGATGGAPEGGPDDVTDLRNTLTALEAANDTDGPLAGGLDLDQLGAEGHSAGGRAVAQLSLDAAVGVDTFIGYAPAPPVSMQQLGGTSGELTPEERATRTEEALAAMTPPSIPTLIVPAENDGIIPLNIVMAEYEWLAAPKQFVVVANAGHNAFTDVCKPIREQGGLTKYAETLPAFAGLFRSGEDGCTDADLDPDAGYALVNHLAVAQYNWVFGIDPTHDALSAEFLEATFPDATGQVDIQP